MFGMGIGLPVFTCPERVISIFSRIGLTGSGGGGVSGKTGARDSLGLSGRRSCTNSTTSGALGAKSTGSGEGAVTTGKLHFGPWEQIFYGEFDGRRKKRVLVKIIGE